MPQVLRDPILMKLHISRQSSLARVMFPICRLLSSATGPGPMPEFSARLNSRWSSISSASSRVSWSRRQRNRSRWPPRTSRVRRDSIMPPPDVPDRSKNASHRLVFPSPIDGYNTSIQAMSNANEIILGRRQGGSVGQSATSAGRIHRDTVRNWVTIDRVCCYGRSGWRSPHRLRLSSALRRRKFSLD
jgi:hypothetical protein